jgi:hypothetical protein
MQTCRNCSKLIWADLQCSMYLWWFQRASLCFEWFFRSDSCAVVDYDLQYFFRVLPSSQPLKTCKMSLEYFCVVTIITFPADADKTSTCHSSCFTIKNQLAKVTLNGRSHPNSDDCCLMYMTEVRTIKQWNPTKPAEISLSRTLWSKSYITATFSHNTSTDASNQESNSLLTPQRKTKIHWKLAFTGLLWLLRLKIVEPDENILHKLLCWFHWQCTHFFKTHV